LCDEAMNQLLSNLNQLIIYFILLILVH
jgi:hypothetical protein